MATLLLGAQGGDEDCFACLYALTNPVLVRYLRVVSDADPAGLARSTWPTLVDRMMVCVVDDDDDWLEVAVGAARQSALASMAIRSGATPAAGRVGALPARTAAAPGKDSVDAGVAALRSCTPAVAEVLAMGVAAGLGKDSIARITGREPTEVLALVRAGEDRLGMPLEGLVSAMQSRGSPAEVGDLPAILPVFAARSQAPLSAVGQSGSMTGTMTGSMTGTMAGSMTGGLAGPAAAASDAATPASVGAGTVVNLLTWHSPAQAASGVVPVRGAQPDASARWARVGVGAAVWTLGVGGVAAAAAMIGIIPAAIHGLFGDGSNGAVVASHGPLRPGGVPSPSAGGPGSTPLTTPLTTPPPSAGQSSPSGAQGPQGQVGPAATPVSAPISATSRGDVVVSASATDVGASTQLVVAPAVLTVSTSGSAVTTPSAVGTSTTPPTTQPPTAPPPSSVTVTPSTAGAGAGAPHASGKRLLTHTTALAKRRSTNAHTAAKTAVATRAHAHKAAKAKAAKAKVAGKAKVAKVAGKAKAAKSRA